MAVFAKYDGIAASLPTSALSSNNSPGGRNGIIDVGDLPGGVKDSGNDVRRRADTAARHESAAGDVVDLSAEGEQANQAAQSVSTNPVGIEPNPTPKPLDSANSGIDRRV